MMIADTDVLIDFLRNREPFASRVSEEIEAGALRTTAISRRLSRWAVATRQKPARLVYPVFRPSIPLNLPSR